ncbi:MAG: hypothetical protein AAGU75_10615 [Bacillota bacterium]
MSMFVDSNLIALLTALFAINTTTSSLILTNMRTITQNQPDADFTNTLKAMKLSTTEQLFSIIVAILLEIAKASPFIVQNIPSSLFIINGLLNGVLAFAIYIVYDTAKAAYVIIGYKN